jgi:hypothetical protein
MTRFETTIAVLAAALIAVAYSPALAQRPEKGQGFVRTDDGTREVTVEVKGPPAKATKGGRVHKPGEPPVPVEPTFTVKGGFEETKERARDSAIRAATEELHKYLLRQDPPVERMPTTKFVRKLMIESQEKIDLSDDPIPTGDGTAEKMYQVTVAVKVEPHHVRELRSQDRASEALWVLAGLGGLAAVFAGFFRVDAWTKGYLTNWLVLGTVGALSLLAGLWWWAK